MPPEIVDCWLETEDGQRTEQLEISSGETAQAHVKVEHTGTSGVYDVDIVATVSQAVVARRDQYVLARGEFVEVVTDIGADAVDGDSAEVFWLIDADRRD
jgi:uncharacterized protein YegJ (DUF2314 family)